MANKKSSSKKSSSSKTTKKVVKAASKMAKKNPKVFVALVIIAIIVLGIGIGGYFAYRYFNPEVHFALKGKNKVSVALDTTYKDKGVVATYNGKDISNEVVISYYLDSVKQDNISTNVETTYTVKYNLDYQKFSGELERKVVVTEVEPIDINFLELGVKNTGDCTFIKAGDTDILIDCGAKRESASTIRTFINANCDDGILEYVIATHAHEDHISGFVGVESANDGILKNYKVDTLIDFALTNSTSKIYKDYAALRDAKVASGDIAHHYTANECIKEINGAQKSYDIGAGITMEILDQRFYRETSKDENNYSVCALFTQGENNYLFTGDLEKEGEASLVELNSLPEVELFKGGHHGSYTANTDTLLSVIKPKNVCICCCAGSDEYTSNKDNMFPAQAAINRIAKYTDKVYVTTVVSDNAKGFASMNGNINFHSDKGKDYLVTGKENSIILKDTDWFKNNRTWPTY